ncbi:hypothetical protein Tco_0635606 [Tanacetum coccineum]
MDKEDTVVGDSLDGESSDEKKGRDVGKVFGKSFYSNFDSGSRNDRVDKGSMFSGETKVCETFKEEDDSSKKEVAARVNEKSCGDEMGLGGNNIDSQGGAIDSSDSGLDVGIHNTQSRKLSGRKHKILSPISKEVRETDITQNNISNQKHRNIVTQNDDEDIEEQKNLTVMSRVMREKRGMSPSSSAGSGGDRSKKKRKSYIEEAFGGDGVEKAFNKGKVDGEITTSKKKVRRRSINKANEVARRVGVFGNSKDDEAQSKRCNLNMEQVKEIGEMIGVSWKLAEDVMSRKTVDRVDSEEEVAAEEPLI